LKCAAATDWIERCVSCRRDNVLWGRNLLRGGGKCSDGQQEHNDESEACKNLHNVTCVPIC
jgi:hypothetical protein